MSRIVSIGSILLVAMIILCPLSSADDSSVNEKETAYINVKHYVSRHNACRNVLTPEGEFVVVFNPDIAQWIAQSFDKDTVINGLIQADDLTTERFAVLVKFPAYFDAISFETFEDAGCPLRETVSL